MWFSKKKAMYQGLLNLPLVMTWNWVNKVQGHELVNVLKILEQEETSEVIGPTSLSLGKYIINFLSN